MVEGLMNRPNHQYHSQISMDKMTHSRREELKKIIEDCLGKDHGYLPDRLKLFLALEDKVIFKSELLSVEEIVQQIEKTIKEEQLLHIDKSTNYQAWKRLAQQIHDRQEKK